MSYSRRVIVAVDTLDALPRARRLAGRVAGFKFGLPLLLRIGLQRLRDILDGYTGLKIVDLKLADIGYVMRLVIEALPEDIDAVIAHSFIGVRGALDELRDVLEERGYRLILVYTMSHPGAQDVMDKCIELLDDVVRRVRPWGLVVPATRPEFIKRARSVAPYAKLFSPGVGAQGAKPGIAVCSGADYEIVGRALVAREDPVSALDTLEREAEETITRCSMV